MKTEYHPNGRIIMSFGQLSFHDLHERGLRDHVCVKQIEGRYEGIFKNVTLEQSYYKTSCIIRLDVADIVLSADNIKHRRCIENIERYATPGDIIKLDAYPFHYSSADAPAVFINNILFPFKQSVSCNNGTPAIFGVTLNGHNLHCCNASFIDHENMLCLPESLSLSNVETINKHLIHRYSEPWRLLLDKTLQTIEYITIGSDKFILPKEEKTTESQTKPNITQSPQLSGLSDEELILELKKRGLL